MSTNINTSTGNQEQKNSTRKSKWKIIIAIVVIMLIILLVILFLPNKIKKIGKPVLTVETPQKQSISADEEFSVDITLSDMGDEIYPASSMCISFDPAYLEFKGISEGNIMISGDSATGGLPEWSVDVERSNKTGQINIMYLDMTGGKYAFSKKYMGDKHILIRLDFRLRGSAESGDIYNLEITDAVFACTDEENSLASINDTLITENGKVVVTE